MEFNAVKMKIEGIHIGDEGKLDATSPVIHSDTIFSAICNVWARSYGKEDLERMLDNFQNKIPFIVSSAFPYSGEILYFPKPFMLPNIDIPEDKRKEFKKMTSLPKPLFEKYIGASLKEEELITALNTTKSDFSKDYYVPKVAIDRRSSSTELFSFSENRFTSDSGYFFLYQCSSEYLEKFKNIVQILSDEGIGGKKTWGCGQFKCEFKTINIDLPQSDCYCILSLYYPDKDEKLNYNCSYNLAERGGWIVSQTTTKTKRNTVYMLTEGSVFDYKPNGKLVDVSPEGFPHKVYRNGIAFAIPVVRKC
ncbi:MAG TPA: type III-A CRISPR-associated RAMP protein Csm4 [Methanofastidiosum sp.]|jgi:CRISPR-associated protein Csm4|nr:type III-A CRISPR-associated RAMP protein Csm4 [Methanofastidiosum sp.]